MINMELLQEQFEAAGIFNVFFDSSGNLSWNELATQTEIDDAAALVAAHNPNELSKQQEIDAARTAIAAGVIYIQRQLVLSNGATLTDQIAIIRPAVVANVYLTNAMTKMLGLLKLANGWTPTVAVLLNPQNDPDRARYVKAVVMVIASLRGA